MGETGPKQAKRKKFQIKMGEQIKAGALREQAVITLNLTQKKTLKSDFFKPYHLQETHLFLRGYENKFYIN